MITDPTDLAPDLATLSQEHPGWFFTTCWVAAASGPDRRRIVGQRHGVTVSGWTGAEVAAKIALEEEREELALLVADFGHRYSIHSGQPWLALDRRRLDVPEITAQSAAELREALAVLCPPRP